MLIDIKEAAQKTILQIPPTGTPEGVYTEIKQGLAETFTSFIDHLMQALDRQVGDEVAKPYLLQGLAFANANAECKCVISAITGHATIAEMIEASSKVGTPQHVAAVQANAFGQELGKLLKEQVAALCSDLQRSNFRSNGSRTLKKAMFQV